MISRIKQRKNLGLLAAALALVLALVVGGCAPVAPVGERAVKIGLNLLLTGPGASTGVPLSEGTIDAFKYISDEGLLNGIKPVIYWEDTRAEIPRGIMGYKRMKEKGVIVVHDLVTGTTEAITPFGQRDEIPIVFEVGITPLMWTKPIPWCFGAGPGYSSDFATLMKWVKENLYKDLGRAPRFGVMVWEHVSGRELLDAVPWICNEGWEFVGQEIIPVAPIDTSVEWLRLAGKKPDVVFMYGIGAALVTAVKDSGRLEIQKKGIRIITIHVIDELILSIVGEAGEGWYNFTMFPLATDTQYPLIKIMCEGAKRYRNREPAQTVNLYRGGWMTPFVMAEGIRLAIEKVGLENLNGRAVRDGLVSIKDYDAGFGHSPYSMSEAKPWWGAELRAYKIEGGRLIPLSDFFEVRNYRKYE